MVRAIAEDGRKMLIARGVEPDAKVRVVPMGVGIPETVGWNRPIPGVVLCPANLLEVKGHRYLIEAWRILRDRGLSARLWLAGEGELRVSLEALVANLRLSDSVSFLGPVKHGTLLDWYKAGTISAVTLASVDLGNGLHEGIPVALVEAMSYGLPVIATTTGGIPELVKPGTGLLVPHQNPSALADAIQWVLDDKALARSLGESARQLVADTRDIVHVASELESLFRGQPAPFSSAGECFQAITPPEKATAGSATGQSFSMALNVASVSQVKNND
jgi:glycosyltransferase involved in cell wall biosynthesis